MNASMNWICPECRYSTPNVWPHCKRCYAPKPETEEAEYSNARDLQLFDHVAPVLVPEVETKFAENK